MLPLHHPVEPPWQADALPVVKNVRRLGTATTNGLMAWLGTGNNGSAKGLAKQRGGVPAIAIAAHLGLLMAALMPRAFSILMLFHAGS